MSEMEQLAKEALQTAVRDSHDAAFAAGLAYPFIDAKYSERRQKLAQEAQAAANDAYLHLQQAEKSFYLGDYNAVIEARQQVQECFEKARETARLAMIDETELGRCPKCLAHMDRLSAMAQLTSPGDDGARRWEKHFLCGSCNTPWREIYSDSNVLIERIEGRLQ
jgi:hypothetical protein